MGRSATSLTEQAGITLGRRFAAVEGVDTDGAHSPMQQGEQTSSVDQIRVQKGYLSP